MKITYLGHASLAIEVAGKNIIVDPFISANELAKDIKPDQLKSRLYFAHTCPSGSYFGC